MFINREEAGIRLALKFSREENLQNAVIILIPRGGVIVGKVVSEILNIPPAILIVKKIGAPNNPELAIGATGPPVGGDGVEFWDDKLIRSLGILRKEREEALRQTIKTIYQRKKSWALKSPKVKGKTAIVVDDGVATGATAIAASLILKKLGAKKIILATPVISKYTKRKIAQYFDKIIAVETPNDFSAVGEFYREFPQVSDKEAIEIVNRK